MPHAPPRVPVGAAALILLLGSLRLGVFPYGAGWVGHLAAGDQRAAAAIGGTCERTRREGPQRNLRTYRYLAIPSPPPVDQTVPQSPDWSTGDGDIQCQAISIVGLTMDCKKKENSRRLSLSLRRTCLLRVEMVRRVGSQPSR